MRRHPALVLLSLLAIFACGGGSGPSGPSGGGPAGTYRGFHRVTIVLGGQSVTLDCGGSAVVAVNGNALSGNLVLDTCATLGQGGSNPFTGTLNGSTVTIALPNQQAFIDQLRDQLGCTIIRVDQAFTGTLANGVLDASFTGSLQCPQGRIDFTWRLDMTKSS